MLSFCRKLVFHARRSALPGLTVSIVLAMILSGLVRAERSPTTSTLTILHTSEHHGTALPIERMGEKSVAGMARRATLIEAVRRESGAVLLVDSGDILIGSALSSFYHGEPDVLAMNLMGYQAMAAGNHDFDYGLDHLARLQELARFPILCSNLVGRKTALPCQPFTVIRIGEFTIGIIGLLGRHNYPDTFNRAVVEVLDFRDPIDAAQKLAGSLKAEEGVDLVVALTHQDTDEDLALLATVLDIDVIVGGHTEGYDGLRSTRLASPVQKLSNPGPVFVKTHRQGRTLGQLDLQISRVPGEPSPATVLRAQARNLPVTEDLDPSPEVQTLLEGYTRKLAEQAGTVVGRASTMLDGESLRIRSRETRLGNLLADILRTEYGTDIALVNSGQIRDSIPPGPVDFKRVLSVLPFESTTVTFKITGQQLLLALENSASQLPQTSGRFLQVSGLTVVYDISAVPGSRVHAVKMDGEPVNPAELYSVATDAFLADGGDGYTMFSTARDRVGHQMPMRDLLLKELRARPLRVPLQGRIQFLGADFVPTSQP